MFFERVLKKNTFKLRGKKETESVAPKKKRKKERKKGRRGWGGKLKEGWSREIQILTSLEKTKKKKERKKERKKEGNKEGGEGNFTGEWSGKVRIRTSLGKNQ